MRRLLTISIGLVAGLLAGCATPPTVDEAPAVPPETDAADRVESGDGTPSPWLPSREEMKRQRRLERANVRPARRAASTAVRDAVGRAGDRAVGWWGDLPDAESYDSILNPDRTLEGSVSLGTVNNGRVEDAVELPLTGSHHSVIERHRYRNTQWGTRELVDLIRETAAGVAQHYPGSTLRVGNLGRPGGGDIPWSSSHTNGRDADLAFFCEKVSTGAPVVAPDLVHFGADGRAVDHPDLQFDVERNWALVRSLLTHPDTSMQWLFISRPLKKELLSHARNSGASPEIVRRASNVLHQPTDAPPHADHLHVRITCPRQDRLEGCLDYGPRWEWADWHRRDLLARSLELRRALRNGDPSTQLDALEFLREIQSPYAPEVALTAGVESEDPRVRRRALDLASDIAWWSPAAVAEGIALVESGDYGLEAEREAYAILRRSHTRRARRFALSRLLSDSVPAGERALAARALSHVLEPGLVPILVGELSEQPARVREECARLLRRITGHREVESWTELSPKRTREALRGWRKWWARSRMQPRERWLARAFSEHGFEGRRVFSRKSIGELIDLLKNSPDHVAYGANRALHRITDRWIPYEGWSYERLHGYWKSWWETTQKRKAIARRPE